MIISVHLLPSVALKHKNKLPHITGVYYCTSGMRVLYVGKAKDINLRWNSRQYGEHHKLKELLRYKNVRIHWKQEPFWRYDHTEAVEIDRLKPVLNRKREKRSTLLSIVDWFADVFVISAISVFAGCVILALAT